MWEGEGAVYANVLVFRDEAEIRIRCACSANVDHERLVHRAPARAQDLERGVGWSVPSDTDDLM